MDPAATLLAVAVSSGTGSGIGNMGTSVQDNLSRGGDLCARSCGHYFDDFCRKKEDG